MACDRQEASSAAQDHVATIRRALGPRSRAEEHVRAAYFALDELYKETVTKSPISPITRKEPRDVGAPGATT